MPTMGDQNETTGTYRLAVRFGDEILQAGFTTVPNVLLRYQATLGISSSEFNFILQVWYHWWDQKDPYPALGTIAERIGQSRRQVRRYSESLRDKGFLIVRERREPGLGQVTSEYDFTPLLEKLRALYREEQAAGNRGRSDLTAPSGTDLTEGGRTFLTEAPRTSMSPEEYTEHKDPDRNKTPGQENPAISNSFELQTQVFKTLAVSKFSKKRDSKVQKSATFEEPEPKQPGRGASSFQPVGRVLASRGIGKPPHKGPVAARNGSGPAADPAPGSGRHPEAGVAPKRPRGRPRSYPVPPDLELFTRDISTEFHDASKLPSNLSFIGQVLHETGLPSASVLYQLMQEARLLTKSRATSRSRRPTTRASATDFRTSEKPCSIWSRRRGGRLPLAGGRRDERRCVGMTRGRAARQQVHEIPTERARRPRPGPRDNEQQASKPRDTARTPPGQPGSRRDGRVRTRAVLEDRWCACAPTIPTVQKITLF